MTCRLSSHFYAIADPVARHDPVQLATTLLDSGARLLQLRLKEASSREFLAAARTIAPVCRQRRACFIVNDRADIAAMVDADGVHLGQDDLPLNAARELLGPNAIIGASTHSLEQAKAAEAAGANYIGFGPMYSGGVKGVQIGKPLERLREVRAAVSIPIVAIGGITEQRVPLLLEAGADAVAIISDVVFAADIPAKVRAILALPRGP